MRNGRLILTPDSAAAPEHPERLLRQLQRIGFIGPPLNDAGWLAGERFMQWISFMGCSPWLRLEPAEDADTPFTHIRIQGPLATPRLRASANARPPRCPRCRRRDRGLPHTGTAPCPHCGTPLSADLLEWGNDAGYGRYFIELWEIFPGEAAPTEGLLQQLQEQSGGPWRHFYLT